MFTDGLFADEIEIDQFLDAYPQIRNKYHKVPDLKQKIKHKISAKRTFLTTTKNNFQETPPSQDDLKVPLD